MAYFIKKLFLELVYFIYLFFIKNWTIAHHGPLSMGFPRQEYLSGMPFPSPGDLPDPGIKPTSTSPALLGIFVSTSAIWEALSL